MDQILVAKNDPNGRQRSVSARNTNFGQIGGDLSNGFALFAHLVEAREFLFERALRAGLLKSEIG